MLIGMCQSEMNQSVQIFSNCNDIQASAVTTLGLLINLGNVLDSRSCFEGGRSFFCNAITVLCGTDSGSSLLNEQCVQVRDNDCVVEWRIIGSLLSNVSIPDCSSFDDGANLTFSGAALTPSCPEDFDLFCNSLCFPVCGEISPYSDSVTDFYYIWFTSMTVISIIGGIVAFIGFFFKRDTM